MSLFFWSVFQADSDYFITRFRSLVMFVIITFFCSFSDYSDSILSL